MALAVEMVTPDVNSLKKKEYYYFFFSLGETSTSSPAPATQNDPETGQKEQRTVSLKVEATLSEVDVLLRQPRKNLADIKVRGM